MNRRHRTVTLTIVALGSLCAGFIVGNLHAERMLQPRYANAGEAFIDTTGNGDGAAYDPSAVAQSEMRRYALRRFGVFEDDLGTAGASTGWAGGWRLDWIDVRHEQGTARIYHATDNRDPDRRYVATWNNGFLAAWERSY